MRPTIPFFLPPIKYVPYLSPGNAASVMAWCERAGIACRASGAWCDRQVSWSSGSEVQISATPGAMGQVHITLPAKLSAMQRAQWVLVIMAYGVFDGVARESVRNVAWARDITPRGRPASARPKTTAERQRAWRERHGKAA